MAIVASCQRCGKSVRFPDHAAGKKGKCPACGCAISIPSGETTPSASQQEQSEELWYYSLKGERIGPVAASTIDDLVAEGTLDGSSLLWQEGQTSWVRLARTSFGAAGNSPPPLPGSAVSNGLVWTVAFAPVIGTVLQYVIAGAAETEPANLWVVTLALNIGLCTADDNILKKAGYNTTKFGGWIWLVPVYLFKRASFLSQPLGYFVTWMVCFFISLFL